MRRLRPGEVARGCWRWIGPVVRARTFRCLVRIQKRLLLLVCSSRSGLGILRCCLTPVVVLVLATPVSLPTKRRVFWAAVSVVSSGAAAVRRRLDPAPASVRRRHPFFPAGAADGQSRGL